jgi:hypothetical protein
VLCYHHRIVPLRDGDDTIAALAGVLVLHQKHLSDGEDIGVCWTKLAKAAQVGAACHCMV